MNKSKLLASTVLVSAATMMAAGPASAAKLSLGGFIEHWVGWADNAAAAGVSSNFDVKQDGEIYFKFKEKLDNGLTVGGRYEMEAGNGNDNAGGPGFDESSIYVSGSFGKVQLGSNDVAAAYSGGIKVVGPVGIIKSDAGDWLPGNYELNNTDADLGVGDSQNITYWTPSIGGLQIIASYTPDSSDTATSDFDDQETTGNHNALSTSIQYKGKAGDMKFKVAAGYTTVEATDTPGADDEHEAFNVAGQVDMGGFTITAAYAKENIADIDTFWGLGVIYKMDKKQKVSLGFGKGEETNKGAGVADNESRVITLGYERNMGKGVKAAASIFHADADNGAAGGRDVKDIGVVGGILVSF